MMGVWDGDLEWGSNLFGRRSIFARQPLGSSSHPPISIDTTRVGDKQRLFLLHSHSSSADMLLSACSTPKADGECSSTPQR